MKQDGDDRDVLGDTDGKQLWCRQVNVIYLGLTKGSGQQAPPSTQSVFRHYFVFQHFPIVHFPEHLCLRICSPTSLHISAHWTFNLFYRIQMGIWAFKGNPGFLNLTSWVHLQPRNCKGQNQWGITHPIYHFPHQDKTQGPLQQGKLLSLNLNPLYRHLTSAWLCRAHDLPLQN